MFILYRWQLESTKLHLYIFILLLFIKVNYLFCFSETYIFVMNKKEKIIVTPIFDSFRLKKTVNDTIDVIKHEQVKINVILSYLK